MNYFNKDCINNEQIKFASNLSINNKLVDFNKPVSNNFIRNELSKFLNNFFKINPKRIIDGFKFKKNGKYIYLVNNNSLWKSVYFDNYQSGENSLILFGDYKLNDLLKLIFDDYSAKHQMITNINDLEISFFINYDNKLENINLLCDSITRLHNTYWLYLDKLCINSSDILNSGLQRKRK